jgi:quercetin dioxygenase-like cupin family protein
MDAHDIAATLADLPELKVTASTTEADAMAAVRIVTSFNQCMVGTVRFSGLTPWERHPDDELLHVLQGEVEVTVLTESGAIHRTLRAGSVFVVPRGLWHRQHPRPSVTLMFVTSQTGNEASRADDPRLQEGAA